MRLLTAASIVLCLLSACGAPQEPPAPPYRKVSEVVRYPEFIPGLGTLYVQPNTMPYGPYMGYDRRGRLVNMVYMVPPQAMDQQPRLKIPGTPLPVNHVVLHTTKGHPGVEEAHYHITLWFISPDEVAQIR